MKECAFLLVKRSALFWPDIVVAIVVGGALIATYDVAATGGGGIAADIATSIDSCACAALFVVVGVAAIAKLLGALM